jgi:16S rRNA (cytosine967-C5)-methyltransferase
VFGDERAEEGAALATRAPLDLRVNTLKTDLARALKALAPFDPRTPDLVPNAIRIPAPRASERAAAVETAPEFERGWFEVQDLGSQWAATMAGDIKGRQVLDLCAGGGGKTLALAAAMANSWCVAPSNRTPPSVKLYFTSSPAAVSSMSRARCSPRKTRID